MGHFLAWLARLLRLRRSLQLLAFSSYAYCRSRSALFHYGGSIIRNSLAILMALVVGVLRARSFLRLIAEFHLFDTRFVFVVDSAFTLALVLSFAPFLFVFVWSFEVVLSESADFAFR